ncbi:MAG: DUF1330 domain-containing protein [Erythrobacter sp.]
MSAYLIVQLTIEDQAAYDRYQAGFPAVFALANAELLSIDDDPVVVDGEFNASRSVLLKFSSIEDATTWMELPEYKAIAADREAAGPSNAILVRGFDPANFA